MNEPEIWDNTKLSSYVDCMQKGHLGYEEHLTPKEPSEALAFGKGIHAMAEVWTKQSLEVPRTEEGKLLEPLPDPMIAAKAAFLEIWNADLPLELREKLEFEGNRRSYANACRLFEAYTRKFPLEMYDKIVALETPFTLYLGRTPAGREISWSGILDRAVEWQGGIYYVDIKTSSYPIDDKFFSQFRFSSQMLGYCWAGQELSLGNFAGIMIQGIEVKNPQVGVKLKRDGTPYAKQGREAADLIGVDIIPILPEHIEEWKKMVLHRIDEIHAAREANYFPMAMGHACNVFGMGCEFRRICYAHPDLRERKKLELYDVKAWNPLVRERLEVVKA